jgi:hypothetical protein
MMAKMVKYFYIALKRKSRNPEKKIDSSPTLNREEFAQRILAKKMGEILEIGPLNRPLLQGTYVKYFDLLPTVELKKRAAEEGLDPLTVPEIHFSDPQGSLLGISKKFSDVVSAHCLEHQPNLIHHLNQVSELLSGLGSRYWAILPDKRYCFDALLPESSLSEVVRSHIENLTKPSIWKVIEHRAMTTHNDSTEHWQGSHGEHGSDLKQRWDSAVREFESSDGKYIDVHCWQFTPNSFSQLISNLHSLGFIDFEVEELFQTPFNGIEFCVVLKKTTRKY